jgi:hypothetical protein
MATPKRNSILGRRPKVASSSASADRARLIRRQLNDPDPVRRIVAREAMRPSPVLRRRVRSPVCRYCGDRAIDRAYPICIECLAIRNEWETRAMGRFAITDQRGWTGPALFEPEEFLARRQRELRDGGRTRIRENGKRTRRARQGRKAGKTIRTSTTPSDAPDNPQESWGNFPKNSDPNPPIRLVRRVS